MTETRFLPGNPDATAISKRTKILGESCWKKAVFVLTYANIVASINFTPEELKSEESKASFQASIRSWKAILQATLLNEAGIAERYDIKVVPAGHYKQLHLPDRDYWLSILWNECITILPSEEMKEVLMKMNASRLKENVVSQDFEGKEIHEQPILYPTTSYFYRLFIAIVGFVSYVWGKITGR